MSVADGVVVAVITMIGGFTAWHDSLQTGIMLLGCGLMVMVGLEKPAAGTVRRRASRRNAYRQALR
jgi:Na+/pantothenate symporter